MRVVRLAGWTFVLSLSALPLAAADKPASKKPEPKLSASNLSGLELRTIGPALMSGRIADIAIDPAKPTTWYVAVGSGGVWKTTNSGTTWKSVFDGQTSYSIGCVTLDPAHPGVVWVGTGENVGGRHVGFGDGVYWSGDGGEHWEKRGLEKSEHISRIVVHPKEPNTVWVASQGPLWSPGGERGVYKTKDGGKTWKKVLGTGDWAGATDLLIDPRNPDLLYAATWQHQRSVAAYIGGGPESRIHRSTDGGETWTKLDKGLPEGNWGKIGLAISPQNPDVVYAAIELDRRKGGVWRSADRGASWVKGADAVGGGTGPHYYQELWASPHAFDRLYLAGVRVQVSEDGGKTFRQLKESKKHSDNHAIAFRPDDPDYLMVGSDGGLYESHDLAENWRFIQNLPVTQFYKIALDDDQPFYNVYGGTQDNSTQGGPSRTDNASGVRNRDWFITLFADGHQPATEPGNPDILYSEWQGGNLVRYDRKTGEIVYITPQPEPGDAPDRFNWDSPILVSPHSPTRLFYASQRVWRSDDRGDSWRAISSDLTRNQNRLRQPLMGRQWSYDAPWDMGAMSLYGTVTSLAESPLQEGLIYAGTDDGLLQVSDNGGANWTSIDVTALPKVPAGAFINDVKADLHDRDTVYVALDHHKSGDFTPYLYKSTDRGKTWRSIVGDLPARHLVWRLVQDHVKPELLFAGTEFGIFFTVDGGNRWVKLQGGAPTISFRDLAIHRRENDLVGASFGRGIWILDDYTPLRQISEEGLASPALLFPTRKTWWYIPQRPLGDAGVAAQGAAEFMAPNPPFGAVFTYYLGEGFDTRAKQRQEAEKKLLEGSKDTPLPGWEAIEAERIEAEPAVLLTVRDAQGQVVRRIEGPASKGFHRVAWDLRYPLADAITEPPKPPGDDDFFPPVGVLAAPGRYSVELAKRVDGQVTALAPKSEFEVAPLRSGTLPGSTPEQVAAYQRRVAALSRSFSAAGQVLENAKGRVDLMRYALQRSVAGPEVDGELEALRLEIDALQTELNGNRSKGSLAEPQPAVIGDRLAVADFARQFSTYGPTPTHSRSLEIAEQDLAAFKAKLNRMLTERLPAVERRLLEAGAPWTPGQAIP